jgi:dynein heavy chain
VILKSPPLNCKTRLTHSPLFQVDSLLKKIGKYTSNPDFTPEAVGKVSGAAKGLCLWVRAMETYGYVSKEVGPKKEKLKNAQATLAKKQAALQAARDQLAAVSFASFLSFLEKE